MRVRERNQRMAAMLNRFYWQSLEDSRLCRIYNRLFGIFCSFVIPEDEPS